VVGRRWRLGTNMERLYSPLKRVLDVFGAGIGLVLSAPLMFVIAIAIRATMGGPVLFRQRRAGYRESPFSCIKFRTMTDERGEDGELLAEELRTPRLGLFLRTASLDELPQFWNILRGDLSFVGPRPLFERYIPYYTPEERRRHSVRPGLTGWAQIHGRRNLGWNQRLALDVWYVDNISFWVDLRILACTFFVVLTRQGNAQGTFIALDEERRSSAEVQVQ
jgi:sugar transferase EpsL